MLRGTLKRGMGSRNALRDLEMRPQATKCGLETWDLKPVNGRVCSTLVKIKNSKALCSIFKKPRAWQSQTLSNPTLPEPFLQTPPLNQKGSGRQTLFAKAWVAAGPWHTSHLCPYHVWFKAHITHKTTRAQFTLTHKTMGCAAK